MTKPVPTFKELRKQQSAKFENSKPVKIFKVIMACFVVGMVVLMFTIKDDPKPVVKNHETMAIIVAQDKIKAQLKSPSTADFEFMNGQVQDMGEGRYLVRDHVDSQNGFGATVRSEYIVELQFNGGDDADPKSWTVTNLVIN